MAFVVILVVTVAEKHSRLVEYSIIGSMLKQNIISLEIRRLLLMEFIQIIVTVARIFNGISRRSRGQ